MGSRFSHDERPTTKILLQVMRPGVALTNKQLQHLTGRAANTILKALHELEKRGMVRKLDDKRNARWIRRLPL